MLLDVAVSVLRVGTQEQRQLNSNNHYKQTKSKRGNQMMFATTDLTVQNQSAQTCFFTASNVNSNVLLLYSEQSDKNPSRVEVGGWAEAIT